MELKVKEVDMTRGGYVLSIGVDLCDTRRIEKSLSRFGERFLKRIYTPWEREQKQKKAKKAQIGFFARRWAAKEACAKALGTGFADGVAPSQIEVRNHASGQPYIVLYGTAKQKLEQLAKENTKCKLLISMTDDIPYAFSEVCIVCTDDACGS